MSANKIYIVTLTFLLAFCTDQNYTFWLRHNVSFFACSCFVDEPSPPIGALVIRETPPPPLDRRLAGQAAVNNTW